MRLLPRFVPIESRMLEWGLLDGIALAPARMWRRASLPAVASAKAGGALCGPPVRRAQGGQGRLYIAESELSPQYEGINIYGATSAPVLHEAVGPTRVWKQYVACYVVFASERERQADRTSRQSL